MKCNRFSLEVSINIQATGSRGAGSAVAPLDLFYPFLCLYLFICIYLSLLFQYTPCEILFPLSCQHLPSEINPTHSRNINIYFFWVGNAACSNTAWEIYRSISTNVMVPMENTCIKRLIFHHLFCILKTKLSTLNLFHFKGACCTCLQGMSRGQRYAESR